MVPQPQAAADKPPPKPAPLRADGRERRWPRSWAILSALAASAALWVVIYFLVTSAAGLIGGVLR